MQQRLIIWHQCRTPQFCTDVRCNFLAALTQNEAETSYRVESRKEPVVDDTTLSLVDAVVIQRPATPDVVNLVAYYTQQRQKYNFNIVLDFDDSLWELHQQASDVLKYIAPGIDYAVVSTRPLKKDLEELFKIKSIVVPNLSSDYLIHKVTPVSNRILYAGNGNHSADFNDSWKEALNGIQEQGWEFHTLGDRIPGINSIHHDAVNTWNFGRTLNAIAPSIYIAPLNPERKINRCKSNLKYIEAAAMGSVFLGSKLPGEGPYNYINEKQQISNENAKEIIERIQFLQDNSKDFIALQDEYLKRKHLAMTDSGTIKMWLEAYLLGKQQQEWR